METNQLIRVGVAHRAMRAHLASTVMPLRGRSATPSAGFFCPGQMAPISPEPL